MRPTPEERGPHRGQGGRRPSMAAFPESQGPARTPSPLPLPAFQASGEAFPFIVIWNDSVTQFYCCSVSSEYWNIFKSIFWAPFPLILSSLMTLLGRLRGLLCRCTSWWSCCFRRSHYFLWGPQALERLFLQTASCDSYLMKNMLYVKLTSQCRPQLSRPRTSP